MASSHGMLRNDSVNTLDGAMNGNRLNSDKRLKDMGKALKSRYYSLGI